MKVKTSELIGIALDYAVAKCEGGTDFRYDTVATYWITINGKDRALSKGWAQTQTFLPSTDWTEGGPIIEREKIDLASPNPIDPTWCAMQWRVAHGMKGPTPLIAAMRCYVASKFGEEVEIPSELED